MEIGRSAFTSNMLCKGHNNKLSKVDSEAVRLRDALRAIKEPMKRTDSKILQPPPEIKISGTLFGQWICKTHCNFVSVSGYTPEISYVQYAFAERPEKPIFFYFAAKEGAKLKLGDEHYKYILPPIIKGINPVYDFAIIFSGIIILVATSQIENFVVELHDRISCIQRPTPLGFYKIFFDFNNEPLPQNNRGIN